jgi:hypothetical protein
VTRDHGYLKPTPKMTFKLTPYSAVLMFEIQSLAFNSHTYVYNALQPTSCPVTLRKR